MGSEIAAERDASGRVLALGLDGNTPVNALSSTLVEELRESLERAAGENVRIVAIHSLKEKAFCGGLDLRERLSTDGDAIRRLASIQGVFELLRNAPFVTVAQVDGPAMGAGADLVAACDYRLASERARFRFPGTRFGLLLGLQRLTAVVGATMARELALRARTLDAAEAHGCGLVTHLLEAPAMPGFCQELLDDLDDLDPLVMGHALQVTRAEPSPTDANLLIRSASRPGIASRIGDFASSRVGSATEARR